LCNDSSERPSVCGISSHARGFTAVLANGRRATHLQGYFHASKRPGTYHETPSCRQTTANIQPAFRLQYDHSISNQCQRIPRDTARSFRVTKLLQPALGATHILLLNYILFEILFEDGGSSVPYNIFAATTIIVSIRQSSCVSSRLSRPRAASAPVSPGISRQSTSICASCTLQ